MSTVSNGVGLFGKTKGWQHWTTPKLVLDVIRRVNVIHLDPCSNANSQVQALVALEAGGLEEVWHTMASAGLAFVNPPYDQAKEFVRKCIVEGALGCEIVLLVASRTETHWSQACMAEADAACFWSGRIKFENPPAESVGDKPSIASAFYYWGRNRKLFIDEFAQYGKCFDLRQSRQRHTFPVEVQR